MTVASGAPYRHGQPRAPVHSHPYSPPGSTISSYVSGSSPINYQFEYNANDAAAAAAAIQQHQQQLQQQQLPQQAMPQVPVTTSSGAAVNGFTPVSLVVPPTTSAAPVVAHVQPVQPLRPIQPVQVLNSFLTSCFRSTTDNAID